MPSDSPQSADTSVRPRPRVRFRIKLLLILVVLAACGWAGARVLRQRNAGRILERHDAVLEAIIDSVAEAPTNTVFTNQQPTREELAKLLGRTWPSEVTRRKAVLEFGSPFRAISAGVTLDIGQSLADDTSPEEVATQLVNYYTAGMADAGLKRIISSSSANAVSLWKSPDGDLDVWINVDVNSHTKLAQVQINFVDNQRLTLW